MEHDCQRIDFQKKLNLDISESRKKMSIPDSSVPKERPERWMSRLWKKYNVIIVGIILFLLVVFILGAVIYSYFESDIGLFFVIGLFLLLICVCLFLGVVFIMTSMEKVRSMSPESPDKNKT